MDNAFEFDNPLTPTEKSKYSDTAKVTADNQLDTNGEIMVILKDKENVTEDTELWYVHIS